MATFLYRLGRASARHRKAVLAGWLAIFLGIGIFAGTAGGVTSNTFTLPGTETQKASDLLEDRFPAQSGSAATVVVQAEDGVDGPEVQAEVEALAAQVGGLPGVIEVGDPYAEGVVAPDGTVTRFEVRYGDPSNEIPEGQLDELLTTVEDADSETLRVELGGEVADASVQSEPGGTEGIGLLVAIVVLLITFGSFLAMGLPLLTALLGIGITMSTITLLAAVIDLPSIAPTLALMIGLAVGIDYALFIITRHRHNLHTTDMGVEESVGIATATAGSAVVFAGTTVIIAITGLAVVGIPAVTIMGLAVALSVAVAVVVAITLMPAMLGFAGTNIDRFRLPGLKVRDESAEAKDAMGTRWAKNVTRRPWLWLGGGLAVMLILAIPLFSMRLAISDAGTQPADLTTRQAYDLVADAYGAGVNGPLTVVVDLDGVEDPEAVLADVAAAAADDPNVVAVAPPQLNPQGDTAILAVTPTDGPSAESTEQTVHHLRGEAFTDVEAQLETEVLVTGPTAATIDLTDKSGASLPRMMALVIGLTMLVLLVAFRSILVPIKAAVAILLSIAASFGVITAVFQWGWGMELIGLHETVPIVSFLPTMLFAILFGLSMDYEVFIMTRVREEYSLTGDPKGSVLTGLSLSARVITAAAIIMISVFGAFALGDDPNIKMFGIGLAVAVLLDATVVRMVIVPAVMTVMGDRAWWLPGWLDRILPTIDVEGEGVVHHKDDDADADVDADGELEHADGDEQPDPDRVPAGV
jgi:RND superfamily putative drug exporter